MYIKRFWISFGLRGGGEHLSLIDLRKAMAKSARVARIIR